LRAGREATWTVEKGRSEVDQGGGRIHREIQSIQLDLDPPVSSRHEPGQIELDKGANKQFCRKKNEQK
jgi:hypothetical protein